MNLLEKEVIDSVVVEFVRMVWVRVVGFHEWKRTTVLKKGERAWGNFHVGNTGSRFG
jgi:hypothetical protein